jgi:quercetin dioxygenase-like cupin family protein
MFDPAAVLTHLETLKTQAGDWGRLTWLCNGKLLPETELTLGLCEIFPGKGNPLHYHPNCEELLHVLSGTGKHLLGEQWFELTPGATIRIPVGVHHKLICEGTESLCCVIAFSSPDRQTVFLE